MGKRILYIHGGGDIIGGVENSLLQSLDKHVRYKPIIGIVKRGKFFYQLKERGIKIVDFGGGRFREIDKTWKVLRRATELVREEDIKCVIPIFYSCIS